MMDPISIPDARRELHRLAMKYGIQELQDLANRMVRRKPKYPTARARRGGLTKEKAAEIRRYKELYPDLSNRDIGEYFGVDGGRVSEAIHDVNGYFKEGDK